MVTIYPTAFGARSGRHAPWHMKNGSNQHRVHPSRIATLLSSHSSSQLSTPLPHTKSTAVHKDVVAHTYKQPRKAAHQTKKSQNYERVPQSYLSPPTCAALKLLYFALRKDALIINYYASADLRVNKCAASTYIPHVFEKKKWPTLCFGYAIFRTRAKE